MDQFHPAAACAPAVNDYGAETSSPGTFSYFHVVARPGAVLGSRSPCFLASKPRAGEAVSQGRDHCG